MTAPDDDLRADVRRTYPTFIGMGTLGTALVCLKLAHVIECSWAVATMPWWGPVALVVIALGMTMAVVVVIGLLALTIGSFLMLLDRMAR